MEWMVFGGRRISFLLFSLLLDPPLSISPTDEIYDEVRNVIDDLPFPPLLMDLSLSPPTPTSLPVKEKK